MKQKVTMRNSAGWSGNWSLLRDIEIISAVVLERKTTGAADRLGISQPSVSRAVAKIEARLQKKLFHREAGRLVPTAEALRLYEQGNALFDALAGARNDTMGANERITVLAPPTLAHLFLVDEIAKFNKLHPQIMILLDVVMLEELPVWIAGGRGDVALTDTTFLHSGVTIEPFFESTGACVLQESHPLAQMKLISPKDLDAVDYVAIQRRHSLRGALDAIFLEAGVKPNITIETGGALLAAELIKRGLGVSVLNPFPLAMHPLEGILYREFDADLDFRTNFLLPANTTPSVSTRLFLDFMKERKEALSQSMGKWWMR